jgi:hypothetical protein
MPPTAPAKPAQPGTAAIDPSRLPPLERFRPFTRRQKLIILAVALSTTATIMVSMLTPHIAYLRAKLALAAAGPPESPPCVPGQTEGCVGGTMGVIMVAPAAVPAPTAGASR